MKRVRVVIISEHQLDRDALRALLKTNTSLSVVGDAGNPYESVSVVRQRQPHVILLDADLPLEKDFRLLRELVRAAKTARVIYLHDEETIEVRDALVANGVRGMVAKRDSGRSLINAILKVHKGELWLTRSETAGVVQRILVDGETDRASKDVGHPHQSGALVSPRRPLAQQHGLTAREVEVATLVAEGLKNQQVAKRLDIRESTVRHHLTSIFDKCQVTTRSELMVLVFKEGLIHRDQKND